MDVLTKAQRSRNMSAIKGKNTRPELAVRSIVHHLGYRYSLHRKDLPGKPDITLVSRQKIILVHGCFWHMHKCRFGSVTPVTNARFWETKRIGNVHRDKRNLSLLRRAGWCVLTVWECQTCDKDALAKLLQEFLES
jgi:DNA mismatch endonuclease (patch repair protein)